MVSQMSPTPTRLRIGPLGTFWLVRPTVPYDGHSREFLKRAIAMRPHTLALVLVAFVGSGLSLNQVDAATFNGRVSASDVSPVTLSTISVGGTERVRVTRVAIGGDAYSMSGSHRFVVTDGVSPFEFYAAPADEVPGALNLGIPPGTPPGLGYAVADVDWLFVEGSSVLIRIESGTVFDGDYTLGIAPDGTSIDDSGFPSTLRVYVEWEVVVPATVPGTPTIGTASAEDASASISFSAPSSDGGSPITGYTAVSNPGNIPSDGCTESPCTVTGLTNGTEYTFTVFATNAMGDGPASAPSNAVVPKGSQTISFAPLANKLDNDPPFGVSATGGNSSQPVTFASLTEPVCTTSGSNGSTVTLTGQLGTCTVRASQAGDDNYAAAEPVDQSFEVTASNQPPTIDLPAAYSMLEDGSGSISFTVGDDLTPAADLTVEATSDNIGLISDGPLAAGLGGTGANRTLAFFPGGDENGSALITVTVTDGNGASEQAQLALTVTPVNDPPSAAYGQNEVWPAGETGGRTAAGFVSLTSAGPGNESGQSVSIDLAIDSDPDVVLSAASIQPNGDLTYTLSGSSGAARITLQAVDDGGSENGGSDRGEAVTRRIIVGDGVDVTLSVRRGQPQSKHLGDALAKGATMAAYSIEVRNNSAQDADGLRLQVKPIIGLTDTLWNCVISTCTPPNGSGDIDTVVDLQAGGVLLVGLSGTVDSGVPFVEITAKASLPQGVKVLLPDDDEQVFIEPSGSDGVYKSGFE